MDWEVARLLIVPALTLFFQALKKIEIVARNDQYIPLSALILGAAVTLLWALAQGPCGNACIVESILWGMAFGGGSIGLYEFGKDVLAGLKRLVS